MFTRTNLAIAACAGLGLAGALGNSMFGVGSVVPMSFTAEGQILGGSECWTATECITGGRDCPVDPCPENRSCTAAGVGPGAICPGTGFCDDNLGNGEICSAPYSTCNPLDFNCVTDPAYTCNYSQRVCNGGSGTCSDWNSGPNAGACGTSPRCHY
jgi:hypothetical protein